MDIEKWTRHCNFFPAASFLKKHRFHKPRILRYVFNEWNLVLPWVNFQRWPFCLPLFGKLKKNFVCKSHICDYQSKIWGQQQHRCSLWDSFVLWDKAQVSGSAQGLHSASTASLTSPTWRVAGWMYMQDENGAWDWALREAILLQSIHLLELILWDRESVFYIFLV